MTFKDLEREQIVDELLLDADLADAPNVRQVLLTMGQLSDAAAPAPGKELAAMLAGPHDEVTKRRWRHKYRTAVVGVVVVAGMGLGVSGVAAASSGFTRSPSFEGLFEGFAPHGAPAPVVLAPDAPRVSSAPAPPADPAAIPQPVPSARSLQPVQPTQPGMAAAPVQIPAPVLAAPQPIRQSPGRTIPGVIPPAPHPAAPQLPAANPTPAAPAPKPQSGAAPSGKDAGSGLPSLSNQRPLAELKAAAEKLKRLKKPVER